MAWADEPLTGFALATTGLDPATARMIAVGQRTVNDGANAPASVHLVRCAEAIPADATAVHGLTNADLEAGADPAAAITALVAQLTHLSDVGQPVVLFNARWILTVIRAEAARVDLPVEFPSHLAVIDPLIIDQHLQPARHAGARTLKALCTGWGSPCEGLGPVQANADAALRLAWTMGHRMGALRDLSVPELVAAQRTWWREREEERQTYLRSRGRAA